MVIFLPARLGKLEQLKYKPGHQDAYDNDSLHYPKNTRDVHTFSVWALLVHAICALLLGAAKYIAIAAAPTFAAIVNAVSAVISYRSARLSSRINMSIDKQPTATKRHKVK